MIAVEDVIAALPIERQRAIDDKKPARDSC